MEEKPEHLEMAKALYQFKATIAKTLSFKESEHFVIYQTSTKQRNWWQVINREAKVGYVPSNYVTSVQVSPEFVLDFVEECIALLRKESSNSEGCLPNDRQELLHKLLDRKEEVEKNLECKNHVPVPPEFLGSPSGSTSDISPPLILHAPVQSPALFHSEAKIEVERHDPVKPPLPPAKPPKPTLIDANGIKRTVAQLAGQFNASEPKPPVVVSKTPVAETKVSVPETKVLETRKSLSGVTSDIEEIRSAILSRKNSSQDSDLISEETVYNLVEQVRCHTKLSHELSRVAVTVVLSDLERFLPQSAIIKKMLLLLQGNITIPQPMIEHTHDAQRLKVIFSELTSCKDDAQQRSWMLHEDEDVIIDYVSELTSILMNADASICRHVISSDQYSGVVALAQYYQMEVRWTIRQPLLQALGVLCSLDRSIINIFLTSVLPMELARDMKSNPRNIPKLSHSALLLSMILSMGEPMPITHLEYLGVDFMKFVFNHIEDPPDTDADDQIPDLFITLILSYNLQFKTVNENVFIKAISERLVAKTFTEKILLLLNREDDPVRIFDHEPSPPHSVLKLFIDLFSNTGTASLFYTNDVKVLIDIIVRQLADLSPGDQRRNQYLQLCRVVMRNSGYGEHHHRKDDLLKSFTRIFCEETEVSLKDQQLVREISNEFPQYFKS